jgi:hypothetical protein
VEVAVVVKLAEVVELDAHALQQREHRLVKVGPGADSMKIFGFFS